MKKVYKFERTKTIYSMDACPSCGCRTLLFMKQIEPPTFLPYHCECKRCGREASDERSIETAKLAWNHEKIETENQVHGGEGWF